MPNIDKELVQILEIGRNTSTADLIPRTTRLRLIQELDWYLKQELFGDKIKKYIKDARRYLLNDAALARGFNMNHKEAQAADEWINKHFKECKKFRIEYVFIPEGMGTGVEVRCRCGAKVDVSDIDCW